MERNIRLDKETFIKLMTFFKTWTKTAEKKSQAIADVLWSKNMFSPKSDFAWNLEEMLFDPEARDVLLEIIVDAMDDRESDWISYYIYELEWGENPSGLKVYEEDGKTEIPLETLEDLWDILTMKKSDLE